MLVDLAVCVCALPLTMAGTDNPPANAHLLLCGKKYIQFLSTDAV